MVIIHRITKGTLPKSASTWKKQQMSSILLMFLHNGTRITHIKSLLKHDYHLVETHSTIKAYLIHFRCGHAFASTFSVVKIFARYTNNVSETVLFTLIKVVSVVPRRKNSVQLSFSLCVTKFLFGFYHPIFIYGH